ncbi:TetR/AcrR family transcriptional regulator C-terminal domain-containing protein [Actinopolymorpha rutila]|uniref:AcrR family transcriptional regulator n=1 Tax=Actinopolymorpha rutila TaxID=446787 RepID=A0A852Z4R7_9ACTN|nr:TetR/AcrR family transcriptional regulator C-terminal domain-containing protein [Actinopolymorpha rutila]NYH87831.1 AcrR family transcriptional regulator [Actinopolymorpha rutila]
MADSSTASRYHEVVAALRRRIEAGELAPGDRVPSTREITREWGVAMATATKALTELRHLGLVRAVPGVGTVVAERGRTGTRTTTTTGPATDARTSQESRPAAATDRTLTTERVVEAAIAIADAEGVSAASMRRVAVDLGVATMSLYRHVRDKDDLLLRMMDAVLAASPLPAEPPDGWRPRLDLVARTLWTLFRRHPWLAPTMSITRPQATPHALPYTEWVLAGLLAEGLDLQTAFTMHLTLFNYVRGTAVNLESEAEAEATSGLTSEEWMATQQPAIDRIVAEQRLVTFARLAEKEYDFDLDALFEFGLQRLLDGCTELVEAARRR